MKIKITSLILIIALLTSLFTVYSFASELVETVSNGDGYAISYVHYKNSFGDEMDDVGKTLVLENSVDSTYEVRSETNGNKYGYYNFNDSTKNVFMQLSPDDEHNIGPDMLGYMIFEFDFNDFGNPVTTSKFLEVNSGKGSFAPAGGRVSAANILNVANDSAGNYFYFFGDKNEKIYINSNSWVHIRCEFSVLTTDAEEYNIKCYISDEYFESTSSALGNPKMIYQIRFGSTNSTNQTMGLDNITLYTTPDNSGRPVSGLLTMKVGAENALSGNNRIVLEETPLLINGEVYCPVGILENLSDKKCSDDYIVVLENVRYIHIDNVEAAFSMSAKTYDMGLIQIGNSDDFLDDNASYTDIVNLMKTFVFNIPSADEIISDVKANTNGFDHPYLLVNAERFAELKNIYNSGKNGTLKGEENLALYDYINRYITSAESNFNTYCGVKADGTYNGIKNDKIPVNTNYTKYSNNGYDNGGRLSADTKPLLYFAFAYQMTGNLNYARAAYDFMIYLGEWNHWGPDHFLNCADTAAPFAIAYDWLYDAFVQLNSKGEIAKSDGAVYDKSKLATILFTHVIIPGYVQSNNLACPWPGSANSRYATKTSNWNAVCVSGVVMSALMLLNEDVSTAGMTFNTQIKKNSTTFTQTVTPIEKIGKESIHTGLNTYSDYAAKLTSMNLGTLAQYGLNQYVPDGSYIESPSYWAYGTNTFFRLIASLVSAAGDDYGFMDAWGIDTTCYFAVHSESSDYNTWNFNDGSVGQQDSSFFFFVGSFYDDDNLVKIRKKHLNNGKTYSLYDILFYDTTVSGEPELTTEYAMIGIDAFSVRSSWDKGAIYAGIIGGQNNCSHGQLDAGSFVYHNNGKIWFSDLGADNYNMSIGYFSNFNLYRVGPEGHNILFITSEQKSLPYGQLKNANPKIVKSYSGYDGGYAVLDMSEAYGSHVTTAQRGLLFTSSRSTVVIQDEYVFDNPTTAYWFGHYQLGTNAVDDVLISADGRTAFMKSGNDILRVSIVSDNENLTFEIMDAYTYVLDATHRTDKNTMDGSTTEKNRDSIRKLAIKCENVTELNLAVVIEEVDTYEIGTSYSYTNIADWTVDPKDNTVTDSKFWADFDSDGIKVGSYQLNSSSNSFIMKEYNNANHSYLGILSTSSGTTSDNGYFTVYPKNNNRIKLRDYNYVVFDADIFTDSKFIDNATFGINFVDTDGTAKFLPIIKLNDNKLIANGASVPLGNAFKHITVIISQDGTVWVYADNAFLTKISGSLNSGDFITNFEFNLPGASSLSAIFLDNLSVRTFGRAYDATEISALLSSDESISSWSDRAIYQNVSIPLATVGDKQLYTNSEIESAIKNGNDVTLLRDTTGVVNVSNAVTVYTNGYNFSYISDAYMANKSGNNITFSSGSITVKWHIGEEIVTEIYSSAQIATFKGSSSKIDRISFEKIIEDGGAIYKVYTTGWSNVAGGSALSSYDMVVSENNCEFWLVNNVPLDCLFVKIDALGNATAYNSEQDLRNMLSKNDGSYDIVLCSDVELLNESQISMATQGKNVYLNGYTLSRHIKNDTHMFYFNDNATGNFNFTGPGTLEVMGSRTVFTTYASTTGKTSDYGIVLNRLTLKVDGQLADLRIGQHKFISCNIYQGNSSKELFALWNKNASFGTGGIPANLLTVTFDKSIIYSNASLFSYSASSYSEVYIKDSLVSTGGYLISATGTLKFEASGNTSIIASKLFNQNPFEYKSVIFYDGVVTNLQIPTACMNSGNVLANNYDVTLPYRVAENYAKITWKTLDGETILSEFASVGTTPKFISPEVIAYLQNEGSGYTYDLLTVENTNEIVLTPVLKSAIPVLQSMTIQDDLTMYLYIQQYEMENTVKSVKVDNVRIMKPSFEISIIDGVSYYKYKISSFTPAKASKEIRIVIEYLDGTSRTITTSAVAYLEQLLAVSTNENEKILAVKLLKYIQSAQYYFNSSIGFEQEKIDALINQYKEYDRVFSGLKNESTNSGLIKNAIRSACFNLSASVKIRFYLNSEYTGQLSISFNGNTTVYNVTSGMVDNQNYIEVTMPAHQINEQLILSDGVNSASYGLYAYATAMNNTDYKLQQMLICLSEYSTVAKLYEES